MYSGMHPYHTPTHHTVDRGAIRPTYYGSQGMLSIEPARKRGFGYEEAEAMKRSRGGEMKSSGKRLTFEDLRPELQQVLDEAFSKLKISRGDIDSCVYDSLMDFPEPVQDEIVRAFGHADLLTIRNKTGYFIGILKEYRKHGKAISQGNTPDGGPPMPPRAERVKTGSITALPHSVQDGFHNLFAGGQVQQSDLDKSIYDSLVDFDEATQLAILDRFAAADFATVKNKTGFFISILKQARELRKREQDRLFSHGQDFRKLASEPTYISPLSPPLYDSYGNYTHNSSNNYYGTPQHQLPPHLHPSAGGYSESYYEPQRGGLASRYGAAVTGPSGNYSSSYGTISVPDGVPPSFFKIAPSAQLVLANMYNSHMLQPTDLDECVFDSIATFGEAEQNVMCEGFSQTALGRIRNRTAFFIGILKRHRQARAAATSSGFGGLQRDSLY